MATDGTKVPSIYKVPAKADPELRQFAESIKEALEVRLGRRGDPKDRAITLRELIDSGLAEELRDNPFDPNTGTGATDFAPVVFTSSTIPPTPTGFSVSGAFTKIIVSWDNPQYNGLAYTEVWRHTIDEVGTSTRVDTTRSFVWADTVDPGETYFYWVRHVSTSDVIGAFSLSDSATTAKVDASIIQDAVITGQKLVDAAITAVKIAEDAVTTAKIATNAITATEIADDSITTAKILANNVTASEILAGTVTSTQIAADTIAASNMAANSITADNAALADLSVVTAKIVDGAIVNAKIGNLAVDTAQIADAAITTAKVGALSASAISTNTLNVAGLAIDGTMGAMQASSGVYTFSNTNIGNSPQASYYSPESICTPIALTIPVTGSAAAKSFLIRLSAIPGGSIQSAAAVTSVNFSTPSYSTASGFLYGNQTAIVVQIGWAAASYGTSLAWNAAPFYASSALQATYASRFDYSVMAVPISLAMKLTVTTSDTATTPLYIYGFAGLFGVNSPSLSYVLSVEGLYR